MELADFNLAPRTDVTAALLACCDVPAWASGVESGRPYPDVATLLATAEAAAQRFTGSEVDRALAAHPRIGERAHRDGPEAAWSRHEQSTVDRDAATQRALADGNRAYEQRFGRVFLICATGLSGAEVLRSLQSRLANDESTEAAVVADELRKIAVLRLRRVLS